MRGDSDEDPDDTRELLRVLAGYAIAIGIGLAVPIAAVTIYFALAVYMILFRELRRRHLPARRASGPSAVRP